MKTTLLQFIIALLFIQQSHAQTLVAYYPLDGNANDAGGNALHGVVNGSLTQVADRHSNENSAMSFPNNTSSYIQIADNPLLKPASISISCWAQYNSSSSTPSTLVDKAIGSCINDSWFFGAVNNTFCGYTSNSFSCSDITGLFAPQAINQWKFLVFTIDAANGTRSLYVDGVPVATGSYSSAIPYDNTPVILGAAFENGSLAFPFNGTLDEVKIYDGVLSASQIATYYFNDIATSVLPGSGNAISMNGINNNVELGSFFNYQNFTIDLWLNPGATQNSFADIIDNNHSGSNTNWVCQQNSSGNFPDHYTFGINGTGAEFALTPGVWQHLTLVKSPGAIEAYVNGVLSQSAVYNAGPVNYNNNFLRLGSWGGGGRNWNGQMDEVRLWNTALTQVQIRDRMCHSITGSEPLYSNLVGYYNFDEPSGASVNDKSGHSNYGVIVGSSTRVISGAAIGNASAHDYVNGLKTVSLAHASDENFTVTSLSGNPDGIQVYRVDESPNTLTGVQSLGSNNKYFGVFQVGGASAQYSAVYNYNGNTEVNPGNENNLALYKRSNNSTANWSNGSAVLNTTAKTLTLTGESTEYILGLSGTTLPLSLVSFTGQADINGNVLSWITSNERNSHGFEIQHSNDGILFTTVGTVNADNTGGDHSYKFIHNIKNTVRNYYRLKIIDTDERFIYSNTVTIAGTGRASFYLLANPVEAGILKLSSDAGIVTIINTSGATMLLQNVRKGINGIPVNTLTPGIYLCKWVSDKGETKALKFIKN
jgi:hypothetical protein